jgi:flagellin
LDGSFTSQLFQVGANAGQAIAIDKVVDAQAKTLGNVRFAAAQTGSAAAVPASANNSITGMVVNGVTIDPIQWTAGTSATNVANTIAGAFNSRLGETGVYASVAGDAVTLTSVKQGRDFTYTAGTVAVAESVGLTGIAASATAAAGTSAFVSGLDVTSFAGAQKALEIVDAALTSVNGARADLGAIQNRFTSVVANLQSSSENLAASRSRIRDTDFAKETAELTRTQILQQAGTAMLAQANQVPQNVLSLLQR